MIRGNKSLGMILELLNEETSQSQIIETMKKRYDAPEGAIERDVEKALAALREIGALDE